MKEKELHTIGGVAGICNISAKALRYYDKIGLLSPDHTSEENGYRYYSRKTLFLVPVIKYYKQIGFKLEEMQEVSGRNTYQFLQQNFHSKISGLKGMEGGIRDSLTAVRDWYKLIKETELIICHKIQDVSVRFVDSASYYYMDRDFNYQCMESIINISQTNYLEATGQKITGPVILNFSSTAHKMSGTCIRARIMRGTVWAGPEDPAQIMQGDRMAACAYRVGGYEDMGQVYERILKWADTRGYACDQGCFERYVISYWTTRSSSKFVTEMIMSMTLRSE